MKPDLLAAAGRRRPGRRGDVAAGPQGAGPLAAPSTEGSSADLLGQQVVREVLSGAGLGALSPVLAAEMVLQAGGIDSGVLETDSNRQMQAVMNTMGGLTGQDPAGCVQGVMGGMPQVAQQAMQRGMGGMPSFLPGQQQPQQGPPDPAQDLGALFQQLSQIGEGDLDAMLNQVGGQLIQSLGPEGMQELLGAMGVLLDDEQLGQGLQALVPEQVQDLMRQAMPGAEPQQQEKPTEEGAEQVPEEEGEAGQQATVETQEEGASSGAAPAEGQQQQAPGGPGAQQASEQGGGGGGAGGGQGEAPAAEMAPSTAPTETAPQQAPSPVTTQQPPTAPSGPPRRQEPVSPPPAQQPSTQVQSPPPPPAMPPASGGGGGSYDVAPPTGEAAQTEEEGPSEHNIDLQMNLDLPPELQGGGGAEAPEHECDVSTPDVQANVGEGMVPQSDYTANEAQPGGMSGGPSGDAMTDSGVDPAAGAAGVAVQPSAGTEAGSGTPGGGEAAAPEVQEGLNPAANQELAQQPEHTAPTPTAPGSPPDMEAIEAEGGGGGGDLPSANIEGVSYSAGDEHLPNPDAPDVPADFASGGTSQAESQMTQDAAQMDSVQPAVDGQVASEVAPQEEEGNQGILDAIRSFFESLGLFDSQASSTETQAQSQQQQAQASTQALIADAQAQQQAQLAQQSGLPVPAELSQRGETYMQAVTEAEANATAVWAGGPQMQMPSGAQTAMDTASADVSQLQGGAVQPDLAGTVGAVQLPDHGLQPQGFSEVVPAGQQQLDPSAIPQQISPFPGSSGGGGGEAMDQIQADVDSQVASEIEAYQQQVLQEQTDRATQGYDGMMAGTEACYQGSVDNAHSAIAEYDAVDIAGEVAPFDAQAQAAFGDAQSQADAAMSTMDSTFATEQGAFDGALADAQGTFQGSVTDAQGQHGS